MAKSNFDVDFIEEETPEGQDKLTANQRAKVAHQLAAVILFTRDGKRIKAEREKAEQAKTNKSGNTTRGVLDGL